MISTVAFNNCSGKFVAKNALGSINNSSSQCIQKMRSSLKVSDFSEPSMCEEAANYHCDQRRFRPEITNAQTQSVQCTKIAGVGDACITVTTYDYNTQQLQQSASAEEMVEGGSYNRDEVTCINTKITRQEVALIQVEGSNVADVLEKTVEQCRQRSHL
ncbi:MAG: hypothetical protein H7326_00360 [Bdellovibrionaceae bacterium]|nr:hypothetical protein [Pseudobdellovibrionaceae bacterium]